LVIACLSAPSIAQHDLSLIAPDGQTVTLASLRGRVVVLVFASTQDPQCRDEFKALQALGERLQGRPASIYWVSIDPPSVSNERVKNPCGPAGSVGVLRDPSRAAFKHFSPRTPQLPTLVVLNQQGQIHGQPLGGFNPSPEFVDSLISTVDGLLPR
jgi:peroxiredoxin